jgi:hypothetical protein
VKDDNDGFYTKIQPIDVAIQLKDNAILGDNDYINTYKKYLQTQVSNLSDEDIAFMNIVNENVKLFIKKINPNLELNYSISKIKNGHYGDDVFYTRGNVIYFPENIFKEKNVDKITSITLHEIWHILSEQNPSLKAEMYKLIGFIKHNLSLSIPTTLRSSLLTNPDGGDYAYAIKLDNGRWLLPLIRSNQSKYNSNKKAFFDYLQFDVYYINHQGIVEVDKDNSSTVSVNDNAVYFSNIKDNTQYIIHPDEIIADNFMLSILAENKNEWSNFSKGGQELMKNIIVILKKLS